jgi:LacI family transcriptional regulator, galactose operon repressor
VIKIIKPDAGKRPTLADVAREARVSVPTVDRAPVRAKTAQRVQESAARLGYHAAALIGRRYEDLAPPRKLGFLIQRKSSEFYRLFAAELEAATRDAQLGAHIPLVEHMEDLTPAAVAARIARMGERCDALGVVAADHPKVNAAIEAVSAAGKPVYALLSDLSAPSRAGYFGLDHRKAGRTAGWAMARLAHEAGKIAIVVGNHRYLGHDWSEMSFRAYLREFAPWLSVQDSLASFEDPRFAYEAAIDLFARAPDLAGLYAPGGGIEGVTRALRERKGDRRPIVVAMDLLTTTREGLIDGVIDLVIATPLARLSRALAPVMLERLAKPDLPPRSAFQPFDLYVAENV